MDKKIVTTNKKAFHDYFIVEKYIAGIVLTGTEIKSIRQGKASLVDSFCYVNNGEMIMRNSYIAKYEQCGWQNHEERRERKLLLNKKEIRDFDDESKKPQITIIPLKMFINDKGLCKVLIALAKGKRDFDKRETIKNRDNKQRRFNLNMFKLNNVQRLSKV